MSPEACKFNEEKAAAKIGVNKLTILHPAPRHETKKTQAGEEQGIGFRFRNNRDGTLHHVHGSPSANVKPVGKARGLSGSRPAEISMSRTAKRLTPPALKLNTSPGLT